MTPSAHQGVRVVLSVVAAPLAILGLAALLLGLSGRPLWWLVGVVASVHAIVLIRSAFAAGYPPTEAYRAASVAGILEPWSGVLATFGSLWGLLAPSEPSEPAPTLFVGMLAIGGLAAFVGGRYASDTTPLPEGAALGRWSRLTVWVVAGVAADHLFALAGWSPLSVLTAGRRIISALVLLGGIEILFGIRGTAPTIAPLRGTDLTFLRWVFGRWNPVASVGDAVQRSFGVDLRTTWAIQFLRAATAPMALAVLVLGWLSTSLVRVGPAEVAIHERLGRPLSTTPVGPGLHVIAPWPLDTLRRVPIKRVLTMPLGNAEAEAEEEEEEGEEDYHAGPEDTLWARMHAEEEYTLLLGDGRDLVTLDGLLHYRISDPYNYLYQAQNPEQGLRAAAYEALTRQTVGRSLDAVLSENLSAFADQVLEDTRRRCAELHLGLDPVSFTLKGLHPPFDVARDYQTVVSAQIEQQTSIIQAQAYRARRVPSARSAAKVDIDDAKAEGLRARAFAVGEAEAFRSVVDSYAVAPELFRFRRRMETLEVNLAGKGLTIIDQRFEAQGGELWVLP